MLDGDFPPYGRVYQPANPDTIIHEATRGDIARKYPLHLYTLSCIIQARLEPEEA